MEPVSKPRKTFFLRYLYLFFVIATVVFIIRKDFSAAAIMSGISLAFDPFDPAVKWADRKRWQQIVPIIHLVLFLVMLYLSIRL